MNEQGLFRLLNDFFDIILIEDNRFNYKFTIKHLTLTLKKKDLRDAFKNLQSLNLDEKFELYNKKSYEVSLIENSFIYIRPDKMTESKDYINKIEYYLGEPSNEYLLFFLDQLQKIQTTSNILNNVAFVRRLKRGRMLLDLDNEITDLFSALKLIIPRFKTLRIKSDKDRTKLDFETLSYSYLFSLSFNTDVSLLPINLIDDFTSIIRIGQLKRTSFEEIDTPKRKYENDLILYYQKGISSDSIDLKYLSFYHILEHFFEKIYNDDLTRSIRSELTKPSFSYKRNNDITGLIKIIQDKLKYKNEEFQINEPEALSLVLDKFIDDFSEIKDEINSYDNTLINYYKSCEIEFSNGNRVNFDEERSKTLKNLRERIYKTRNSIVHSKETNKNKYLPFKHDKILKKEIILMRLIAEKVIIGSSSEL